MSQEETPLSNFQPFVVRTDNVAKALVTTAAKYKVKASELDFVLLDIQTFVTHDDKSDDDELLDEDEIGTLNDKTLLADPKVHIRQTYEIEIVVAEPDKKLGGLQLSIGANPTMSRLFATIKPGSKIKYYEGIVDDIRRLINKRKLRANMFISIWDKELTSEIEKFVAKVRVQGLFEVEEKITLEVGHALDPVKTVDDQLIMHYEHNEEVDELAKVDYSKRNFIQAVKKNELLIEYIKAKKGENGRSCRGEFIEPTEPVTENAPAFNVSDKIEVIEHENNIEYRAKENGYIVFENNTYDIKVDVEVSEISFKTTGSIEAGVDTDVSINVKEKDAFKDAIGEGMEVEANEINVDGNVGNNAKVKARKVNIGGQTHKTSYIEGDDVNVNIHKGKIKGKNVEVIRLEQGVVEGEKVKIAQASGGKVIAKEVYIETLGSHVDIIANSKIEIQNFKGEENTFTFSPILFEEQEEDLSGKEEEISLQKRKVHDLKEEVAKNQRVLDDNASAIVELKKRLVHYKESGTKMPGAFVVKFKEFQNLQKRLQALKTELKKNEDMFDLLTANTAVLQKDILEAKIINHDKYKGHNEIRFKLIEPELEIYYVPKGVANESCYRLECDEEGNYEIVTCDANKEGDVHSSAIKADESQDEAENDTEETE